MKKKQQHTIIVSIVMALVAAVWFLPIYFMIINSFKPLKTVIFTTAAFPKQFFLENIVKVWSGVNYYLLFTNSFLITAISIAGIVLFAAMAGYRLSRVKSKLSGMMLSYFILTLIIPFQAIMIPLVKTMRDFGMIDTRWGLILVYVALGTPIAIFLYQGYVKTIPYTLEESAIIDGAGPLTIFFRIIFPLLKPMTSTIIILQSLYIWNDFLLPLITITSDSLKTIPLGVAGKFFGQYAFKWNLGITAMLMASLPMLILYLVLQRHIISGVMRGSVKF
jgi:raffinose/stachyose/melibiose transport system permease protein